MQQNNLTELTMNVTIPDSLKDFVEQQASSGLYANRDAFVADLLRREAKMFERVGVPVLGVVENMSYFACPHCGERTEIFLAGGGTRLADELAARPAVALRCLCARSSGSGRSHHPNVK